MVVKHELPSKMLQRACSVEVYLCIFAQVNVVQVVCIEVFKVIRVTLCSLFLGPLGLAGDLCKSVVRCWRSNNSQTLSEDGVEGNAGVPILAPRRTPSLLHNPIGVALRLTPANNYGRLNDRFVVGARCKIGGIRWCVHAT